MLDSQRMREIRALAPGLEVGEVNWQNYEKLTILRALELFQELQESGGVKQLFAQPSQYSMDPAPARAISEPVEAGGDSDFLRAVAGKDSAAAWGVMDELMDTLRVVNVKVYNSVMEKIKRI